MNRNFNRRNDLFDDDMDDFFGSFFNFADKMFGSMLSDNIISELPFDFEQNPREDMANDNRMYSFDRPKLSPREEMLGDRGSSSQFNHFGFQNQRRDIDLDQGESPSELVRNPQIFSQSKTVRVIHRSDGTSEKVVVEKTGDGNEIKTITKNYGDQVERYITKSNPQTGENETIEETIERNPLESNLDSNKSLVPANPVDKSSVNNPRFMDYIKSWLPWK